MAKAPELVDAVSHLTGRDAASLRIIMRRFRQTGLIPPTGKGFGARDMTAFDATCLLLGVAGGSTIFDSPKAVTDYWNCRTWPQLRRTKSHQELLGGFFTEEFIVSTLTPDTFGRAFACILACAATERAFDEEWAAGVESQWEPFVSVSVIGPAPAGKIAYGYGSRPIADIAFGYPNLPADDRHSGFAETRRFGLGAIVELARAMGPQSAHEIGPQELDAETLRSQKARLVDGAGLPVYGP